MNTITSDFSYRVNYAATCMRNKTTGGRGFDNCFEMWDGDYVVTALVRRAEKSESFKNVLYGYLRSEELIKNWIETASKFNHLSNKELKEEAIEYSERKEKEMEEKWNVRISK